MYTVRAYAEADDDQWDDFCAQSPMATFLHTRGFLSYHGSRFRDCSAIVLDGNQWVGAIPPAESINNPTTLVSHPGITYGGVIHSGSLVGVRMIAALQGIARFFRHRGYTRLLYKPVPYIYYRSPAHDDVYAAALLGA